MYGHKKKDYDYVDYSAPQYYLDISKTQEEYVADYLKILNDNNIQIVISQETRTDSLLLLENTPSAVKKNISCPYKSIWDSK